MLLWFNLRQEAEKIFALLSQLVVAMKANDKNKGLEIGDQLSALIPQFEETNRGIIKRFKGVKIPPEEQVAINCLCDLVETWPSSFSDLFKKVKSGWHLKFKEVAELAAICAQKDAEVN